LDISALVVVGLQIILRGKCFFPHSFQVKSLPIQPTVNANWKVHLLDMPGFLSVVLIFDMLSYSPVLSVYLVPSMNVCLTDISVQIHWHFYWCS